MGLSQKCLQKLALVHRSKVEIRWSQTSTSLSFDNHVDTIEELTDGKENLPSRCMQLLFFKSHLYLSKYFKHSLGIFLREGKESVELDILVERRVR